LANANERDSTEFDERSRGCLHCNEHDIERAAVTSDFAKIRCIAWTRLKMGATAAAGFSLFLQWGAAVVVPDAWMDIYCSPVSRARVQVCSCAHVRVCTCCRSNEGTQLLCRRRIDRNQPTTTGSPARSFRARRYRVRTNTRYYISVVLNVFRTATHMVLHLQDKQILKTYISYNIYIINKTSRNPPNIDSGDPPVNRGDSHFEKRCVYIACIP